MQRPLSRSFQRLDTLQRQKVANPSHRHVYINYRAQNWLLPLSLSKTRLTEYYAATAGPSYTVPTSSNVGTFISARSGRRPVRYIAVIRDGCYEGWAGVICPCINPDQKTDKAMVVPQTRAPPLCERSRFLRFFAEAGIADHLMENSK